MHKIINQFIKKEHFGKIFVEILLLTCHVCTHDLVCSILSTLFSKESTDVTKLKDLSNVRIWGTPLPSGAVLQQFNDPFI